MKFLFLISKDVTLNHCRADPDDRWSCTEHTVTGLFRTEAALYALNSLKSGTLSGRGVENIGILILDSCINKLKTAGDLYDLMRNSQNNICENGDKSKCFNSDKVVIVLSDYSSGVTGQVS